VENHGLVYFQGDHLSGEPEKVASGYSFDSPQSNHFFTLNYRNAAQMVSSQTRTINYRCFSKITNKLTCRSCSTEMNQRLFNVCDWVYEVMVHSLTVSIYTEIHRPADKTNLNTMINI